MSETEDTTGKLEQLLKELCPDGVSQYRIDEICDISRGRAYSRAGGKTFRRTNSS